MISCDFNQSFEEHLSILDQIDDNLRYTRQKLVRNLITRLQEREEEWNDTFNELLNRSRESQAGDQLENNLKLLTTPCTTNTTQPLAPNQLNNALSSNLQQQTLNAKIPTSGKIPLTPLKLSENEIDANKSAGNKQEIAKPKPIVDPIDPKENLLKTWRKANKEFNHPSFSNYFAMKEFMRIQEILSQGREGCKDFDVDHASIKSYKTELMVFIRLQINSISGTNPEHLKMKIKNLSDLFNGLPVKSQNRVLDVNKHPVARPFCIDFAAQTCVLAGVRSNINVVKDLGTAINSLDATFPGFRDLVIGHVQERCPFTIPMYPDPDDFPPNANNSSISDFKIACGYQTDPRTKALESDQKYLERMRSMTLFYASVMDAGRIELCWSWLASFISLFPEPVITATVLEAYLSIVSKRMWSSFGRHYEKILALISNKYISMIEQVTSEDVQSLVKLKNLITEESKKKYHLPISMNSIFGSSTIHY